MCVCVYPLACFNVAEVEEAAVHHPAEQFHPWRSEKEEQNMRHAQEKESTRNPARRPEAGDTRVRLRGARRRLHHQMSRERGGTAVCSRFSSGGAGSGQLADATHIPFKDGASEVSGRRLRHVSCHVN